MGKELLSVINVPLAKMAVRIDRRVMEIVRAAQDLNTDLIVISTHRRTRGLKHLLLGSVTEAAFGIRRPRCWLFENRNTDLCLPAVRSRPQNSQ